MEKALKILLKHFKEEVEKNVNGQDKFAYWDEIEDYWDKNIQRKGMLAQFYDYMAYKTFNALMDEDNIFWELEDD